MSNNSKTARFRNLIGRTAGPGRQRAVPWLQRLVVSVAAVLLTGGLPPTVSAEDEQVTPIPPRLSMVEGEVSFWRPGDEEWTPARPNTAVAPGDLLDTGASGRVELQVGGHAFVRADANTEIGLEDHQADILRLQVTRGRVSLDLRKLPHQQRIQVATPHANCSIEDAGYYRVEVSQDSTTCIARSGGRATLTADGQLAVVSSNEQVIVSTTSGSQGAPHPAPALDVWDRWNYGRTDGILAAISERYVPADMYGTADLDRYGSWRLLPTYGRVWVPATVPVAWAPYSAGNWMWDPYYGWTWVDDAPWGWAPFHYGRWVYVDTFWAWAPGPIVISARPVYAPALVAFLSGPGIAVSVGTPFVGWVSLSWGEPLVPWWGPRGFIGVPWWGGWRGPHVVNHVVVHHQTIVHAGRLARYRNARAPRAVIGMERERFVRGGPKRDRLVHLDPRRLGPWHNPLPRTPTSLTRKSPGPTHERGKPFEVGDRSVRPERPNRQRSRLGPPINPAQAEEAAQRPSRSRVHGQEPRPSRAVSKDLQERSRKADTGRSTLSSGAESRRQRAERSGRRSDEGRVSRRSQGSGTLARRGERPELGRARPPRRDDARRAPASGDPPSLAPENRPRDSGADAGKTGVRRDQLRERDQGAFTSRRADTGRASLHERRAPDMTRRPPASVREPGSLNLREHVQRGSERGRMLQPSSGFSRQPAPHFRESRPSTGAGAVRPQGGGLASRRAERGR